MQIARLVARAGLREPERVATIFEGRVHTWNQFADRTARLAGALHALKAQSGDRVALLAKNSDRYLEVYYATLWADCVIVPMNTRWTVGESLYSVTDSRPKILVVDEYFVAHAEGMLKEAAQFEHVIFIGEGATPAGMLNYEELVLEANAIQIGCRGQDDLAGIFYTGGTTGFPKGVMLSHSNLLHSAMYGMVEENYITTEDRYLHVAPMFHLADGIMMIAATMCCASHCFIANFEPTKFLSIVSELEVSSTTLVPTMLQMVFDSEEFGDYDISSLQQITYGGSPMPHALLEKMMAALPKLKLMQGYGQTEMAPSVTLLSSSDHHLDGPLARLRKSVGRAVTGIDLKIVDEDLKDKEQGEIGQIIVRGKNAMLGYWESPEQTAEALVDGWVLTGDAGYVDEDGYLYLVDRIKDMIITGGENVYSAEVENALTSHPEVNIAAVIGIPSEQWGESVHAIVILNEHSEVTQNILIEHCRQRIAAYKCPKSISFRHEPMPLSGAGKILKSKLRESYL